MKKIAIALLCLFISNVSMKADEGMFLVQLIGEKTYADMVEAWLKTYQRTIV